MRTRGQRLRAVAGAVPAAGVVAACGGPQGGVRSMPPATTALGTPGSPAPSAAPRFDAQGERPGGRRVGLSYAAGRGRVERHTDADAGEWNEPHVVYATVDFDGRQKVVAVGGADARRLPFSRAPTETPARQEWRAAGGFA